MKLIRTVSDNKDGIIENLFNTDININENSQIALKNCSFSIEDDIFQINPNNNKITFKISGFFGSDTLEVFLSNSVVSKANFQDMIDDMNLKANNLLSISNLSKIIGLQFANKLGRANKFELKYLLSPFTYTDNYFIRKNVNISSTSPLTTLFKFNQSGSTNLSDDSSRLVSKIPFIKGCGIARFQLNNFIDTGSSANGLYFGITDQNPINFTDSLTPQQRGIYIAAKRLGDGIPEQDFKYEVVRFDSSTGGFITDTSDLHVSIDDKLEIARNRGHLEFVIYEKANADPNKRHVLYSQLDDNKDKFIYVIFRNSSTNLQIQNLRVQLNPEHFFTPPKTLNDQPLIYENELDAVIPTPPNIANKSINEVIFENKGLGEFLGYDLSNSNIINNNIPSQEMFYIAENLFNPSVFNDTYLIVLDNIPLESYDGCEGNQKSILEVKPKSDDNTTLNRVIEYEPNTLNFIDIKNIKKLNVRNIRARILKSDLSQVKLNGFTTITLLIK